MAGCRTLHGFITQAGLQHLGDLMFFVPECFLVVGMETSGKAFYTLPRILLLKM